MKHLLLVGGGHAQLFVLKQLAQHRPKPSLRVTLISPSRWLDYSGMLPGWMAGTYPLAQCRIDLLWLATQAGIEFIEDSICAMDADRSCVYLPDGTQIAYDLLSLDIGSETDLTGLNTLGKQLIPVRPLADFRHAWLDLLAECRNSVDFSLALVGGGAAGVELALAAAKALKAQTSSCKIILIAGARGLLPSHGSGVKRAALHALSEANVQVINTRATGANGTLTLSDGGVVSVNKVIAATGSKPPLWLEQCKLQLDNAGYVLVDKYHRSVSHANVFAAGNICSRADLTLPRSGVHAVKAGPVLARNLWASLEQQALTPYRPKTRSLYLLSCSNGRAIASWGRWSAQGRWVWRIKDAIDRGFIKRFSPKTQLHD